MVSAAFSGSAAGLVTAVTVGGGTDGRPVPRVTPRGTGPRGQGPGSAYDDGVTVATKKVLLAAPRGYCAGVDRAVVTVEKALELYGPPVYVRKEIVHNKHVVTTLQKRGAVFVDETDEVPEGATVVFSAHGVAPAVHEEARALSLKTIDATCPLVTKVHREAVRFAGRRLRHPAHRPRGPRGGGGHRR